MGTRIDDRQDFSNALVLLENMRRALSHDATDAGRTTSHHTSQYYLAN